MMSTVHVRACVHVSREAVSVRARERESHQRARVQQHTARRSLPRLAACLLGHVGPHDAQSAAVSLTGRRAIRRTQISACVDAPRCTENITNYCCKHCRDVHVTLEMPWVDDADPIHVYLSYGQSNCGGTSRDQGMLPRPWAAPAAAS